MTWQPGVISLLVPSRGRPDGCLRMWRSALDTARDPLNLQLVLYLDTDDPTRPGYARWVTLTDTARIKTITGPRIVLSQMWNRCWEQADGEIGWHGNDDITFNTPGWDAIIKGVFADYPDRIVFVHGADGIQNQALGAHGFLHRRWTETVGTFVPPFFSSDYNDTWLTEVADRLGRRRFLPGLDIEHHHPVAGKAALDQTHRDRLVRHRQDNVDALYQQLTLERQAWVDKLQVAMDG